MQISVLQLGPIGSIKHFHAAVTGTEGITHADVQRPINNRG